MRVAQSPAFLEAVANHPRVRPLIGGEGEFRAGESWHWTHAVEWNDGGVVFLRELPRIYSVHVLFLPKAKNVIARFRQALGWAVTQTEAALIIGRPNRFDTKRLARSAGMWRVGNDYFFTAMEWQEQQHGLGSGTSNWRKPSRESRAE